MYFDDIKVGMKTEIAPAHIEKKKMIDFALDYDNIPLHTDEEYAKRISDFFIFTDKNNCKRVHDKIKEIPLKD